MTPTQRASFTAAVIEECGGDSSKVCMSYSCAERARRSIGGKIAKSVKELWMPPKVASLHWDSKKMKSLTNQYVTEERMAVLVGDSTDVKLLGTPHYPTGSDRRAGEIISEHTMELVSSWNCTENIVNMVFDTTSSNTGHVSAACIAIQNDLGERCCGPPVDTMKASS